jgi:hypothetical protein
MTITLLATEIRNDIIVRTIGTNPTGTSFVRWAGVWEVEALLGVGHGASVVVAIVLILFNAISYRSVGN